MVLMRRRFERENYGFLIRKGREIEQGEVVVEFSEGYGGDILA